MNRLRIQKLIFDVEAGHPYVLDWDHNHFRIWRQQLRKESLEELLFDFKLKNTHTLTSASLSADGNYIAVADQIKARIWCVQYNEVKELELPIAKGCQTVAFHNVTPCSSQSQLEILLHIKSVRITSYLLEYSHQCLNWKIEFLWISKQNLKCFRVIWHAFM